MDEPSPQDTEAARQRQRSSIPSFLFISFMLFMLTNNNTDEFLARNQYQNALRSLEWQAGNFSAWLNGTDSNFTMPERDEGMTKLVDDFVKPGLRLDPEYGSYYPNVTGFIRGDVAFHNITPSFISSQPEVNSSAWWKDTELLMAAVNETDISHRLGSWNWTATDRAVLSVVEKTPFSAANISSSTVARIAREVEEDGEQVAVVHGRIDLSSTHGSSGTNEELRLEFEGVHFIANGSIFGLAEPNGQKPDIRLLPSLVPPDQRNLTAHAMVPELDARIAKVRGMIEGGLIGEDTNNAAADHTLCNFTVFLQMVPTRVPFARMADLEEELQRPTGIATVRAPPLELGGVMISRECGLLARVGGEDGKGMEGTRSKWFFRKVTTYASLALGVHLMLLALLLHQQRASRTPSALARLSRWTFLSQALVDAVSFAGHITFAILAEGRVSLALVGVAFVGCVLFVFEAQFALLIHQVQLPEDVIVPTLPPAQVAPLPVATPPPPASQAELPGAYPPPPQPRARPAPATPPQPQGAPARPSVFRLLVRHVRSDPQARLWLTIFICMTFIVRVVLSPSLALLFVGSMYSFFWAAQIYRAARRGRSGALRMEYVVGTTLGRLWSVMYFLACPKNVLDVEPRPWVYLLALFMFLQIGVLILQEYLGPAFFLPARYTSIQTYDYHPPLSLSPTDAEAPEPVLGDCAICMDAIRVDPKDTKDSKEGHLRDRVKVGAVRKSYSLAPCHHMFHSECLERWLAIKNICPQCRRPLPPM